MRITINGEEFANGADFNEQFCCTESVAALWRSEGMPFAFAENLGVSTSGKYLYPVERCRAWFRGEEV